MRRSLALTATAALLALPALTACSGSGSSKAASSSQTSSSASAATSEAAAPSSDPTGEGGDSSAKPSKDDVKAGLVTFYATKGVTGAPATMLAGCIVDKGYDQFSAQTLTAMKDGKPKNIDQKDSAAFVRVTGQCATSAEMPSLPTKQ